MEQSHTSQHRVIRQSCMWNLEADAEDCSTLNRSLRHRLIYNLRFNLSASKVKMLRMGAFETRPDVFHQTNNNKKLLIRNAWSLSIHDPLGWFKWKERWPFVLNLEHSDSLRFSIFFLSFIFSVSLRTYPSARAHEYCVCVWRRRCPHTRIRLCFERTCIEFNGHNTDILVLETVAA